MLFPFVFMRNTDIGTASLFSRICRGECCRRNADLRAGRELWIMLPNCHERRVLDA